MTHEINLFSLLAIPINRHIHKLQLTKFSQT